MVSWWYWCSLQVFLIIGLLLGALVFSNLEAPKEIEARRQKLEQAIDIIETFFIRNSSKYVTQGEKLQLIEDIFSSCHMPNPLHLEDPDLYIAPVKWSFPNAVLFCYTIVTTIGYGHISPETFYGRLFSMFIGLVGIPLNVVLVGMLAGWFNNRLSQAVPLKSDPCTPVERWLQKLALPIFYLIPGTIFFLVIPGVVFAISENWTFFESVYYAFITLTTVGFGDMVAGVNQKYEYVWLHNAVLIVWMMFGLGYLTAVIDVIGRAFSSPTCKKCINLPKVKATSTFVKLMKSRFNESPKSGSSSQESITDMEIQSPIDHSFQPDVSFGRAKARSGFFKGNIQLDSSNLITSGESKPRSSIFYLSDPSNLQSYDNEAFDESPVESDSSNVVCPVQQNLNNVSSESEVNNILKIRMPMERAYSEHLGFV